MSDRVYRIRAEGGDVDIKLVDLGDGTYAFKTSGGGVTIGNPVAGGGANRILFEDASQNVAASASLTYTAATSTFATVNATFSGDVAITGDLIVSGNTVTVDVSTLAIEDPLIKLSKANVLDVTDIGFYGVRQPASTSLYTGLFRDASDGIYKLFDSLQAEPTTTVNLGGTGYAAAPLQIAALTATTATLSSLTAGGIPIIGTAGLLGYDANILWDATNKRATFGSGSGATQGWTVGPFTTTGFSALWTTAASLSATNYVLAVGSTSLTLQVPAAAENNAFSLFSAAGKGPNIATGTTTTNANRSLSISQGWTAAVTGNIGIVQNTTIGAGATGKLLSLQAGAAGTTERFAVDHLGSITGTDLTLSSFVLGTDVYSTAGHYYNRNAGALYFFGAGDDANFNRAGAGSINLGTTTANALGSLNLLALTATGTVTAGDTVSTRKDQNATTAINVVNDMSGTAAASRLTLSNAAVSSYGILQQFNPSYTTSGLFVASSVALFSGGNTNGLRIFTSDATNLILGTNNLAQITLAAGGNLTLAPASAITAVTGSLTVSSTGITYTAPPALKFGTGGFLASNGAGVSYIGVNKADDTGVLGFMDASGNTPFLFTISTAAPKIRGNNALTIDTVAGGITLAPNSAITAITGALTVSTTLQAESINLQDSGAAATVGSTAMVGGAFTISTTAVATGDAVIAQRKTSGGTPGTSTTYTISNGVSFTLTSDNALDTSTYSWVIIKTH